MAEDGKATASGPTVRWDDSQMKTHYANVVNVTSTREEVSLFFGTNRTWNPSGNTFDVTLHDRTILNPFAAKRLLLQLGNVLREYEARFGELKVQAQQRPEGTPPVQ